MRQLRFRCRTVSGTVEQERHYDFSDHVEIEQSQINYRLKQINTDGSFVYSNVLVVLGSIPEEFHLAQNYPNPFNPSTNITYYVSERADVYLGIFNTKGHKIKTLVNKSQSAGSYSVNWNGLDNSGKQMASGYYFYRIVVTNSTAVIYTSTKGMLLLK